MPPFAPAILAILLAVLCPPRAQPLGREEILNPAFTLKRHELVALTAGAPAETQQRILEAPRDFLDLLLRVVNGPQDLLVLVDKTHALAKDFAPADLVFLSRFSLAVSRKDLRLRAAALTDLRAMMEAAVQAGAHLVVSSAYRSFDYQETLFENTLRAKGREQTERELARPGHSQHQLGTAVDFGSIDLAFAETAEGRWLFSNASRFGFSLSYPQGEEHVTGFMYEPWHYRYVGKSAAVLIDEYFSGRQESFLSWYHKERAFLEARRKK